MPTTRLNAESSEPARVLHIVGHMNRAGIESLLMNVYRNLDHHRLQFDFLYFTDRHCDYDDEIVATGGRIYRIANDRTVTRWLASFLLFRRRSWIAVHSHIQFNGAIYLMAAQAAGIGQRIAHSHFSRDANENSLIRRVYVIAMRMLLTRVSTGRMACGQASAAHMFGGGSDARIIPNAIDLQEFAVNVAEGRADTGAEGVLKVVQIARLERVKNHAFSLRLAAHLRQKGIKFSLDIFGDGSERQAIAQQIADERLGAFVSLHGSVSNIAKVLKNAHVLVLPSHHEGFPFVLVESQAAGVPAIVSSTVSTEVDLGLGLVLFKELTDPLDAWVEQLEAAISIVPPSSEIRAELLTAKGYCARQTAGILTSIYLAS